MCCTGSDLSLSLLPSAQDSDACFSTPLAAASLARAGLASIPGLSVLGCEQSSSDSASTEDGLQALEQRGSSRSEPLDASSSSDLSISSSSSSIGSSNSSSIRSSSSESSSSSNSSDSHLEHRPHSSSCDQQIPSTLYSVSAHDPLRLTVGVSGLGWTGYELAELLESHYHIVPELATQTVS